MLDSSDRHDSVNYLSLKALKKKDSRDLNVTMCGKSISSRVLVNMHYV